ncbi:MAG: nucleoside deaminase [Comamonadaceae bacterium]|nr:MAG: nucleoside deaminase [Comamonadaceae bacterium]
MYQDEFMQRALALSAQALDTPGTEPFGAVVVKDGAIVGEGFNHSVAHFDPTSHGEIEAIRDACRKLETVNLAGCDLYTSCEPCALCAAAMHIAGIGQLYYAASMAQSGAAFDGVTAAARHPIDVETLRAEAGAPFEARALPAEQRRDVEAVAILQKWATTRKGSGTVR